MVKEVLVSISGLQYEIAEDIPVELVSAGEYYYRNGKHYVLYDEIEESQEGSHSLTRNTIKIMGSQIEIVKKGMNHVHMVFEEGKHNMAYYSTPFGNLLIGIHTTKIRITQEQDIMRILIEYGLDVNYTHVSDCVIEIKIASRN